MIRFTQEYWGCNNQTFLVMMLVLPQCSEGVNNEEKTVQKHARCFNICVCGKLPNHKTFFGENYNHQPFECIFNIFYDGPSFCKIIIAYRILVECKTGNLWELMLQSVDKMVRLKECPYFIPIELFLKLFDIHFYLLVYFNKVFHLLKISVCKRRVNIEDILCCTVKILEFLEYSCIFLLDCCESFIQFLYFLTQLNLFTPKIDYLINQLLKYFGRKLAQKQLSFMKVVEEASSVIAYKLSTSLFFAIESIAGSMLWTH